ncbi:hypothetical protein F4802DRAFT_581348 [Xylaria palmicola]|nr:hypothetical protein F4802DRAFT_581348 [Xylaria palmicola]
MASTDPPTTVDQIYEDRQEDYVVPRLAGHELQSQSNDMSSQPDTGIPLFHAPDSISYRLMELPPALLEALESADPPVLRLEASASSAILKCGSHAWGLRQKNTSNALLLLKAGEMTVAPAQTQQLQAGLQVVATIHDTIELVPESADKPAPPAKGKWHEKFARGR